MYPKQNAREAFGYPDPAKQWSAMDKDARVHRVKSIGEAQLPPFGNDPNELLLNRYLCRGGGVVVTGPSGVGKSSLSMQVILCWSVGKPALGIRPSGPMKILLIQAENDDGDLAEMREGVIRGMLDSSVFTEEEAKAAREAVKYITIDDVTGSDVAGLIEEYGAGMDLVMLDPLFAYCGCSVSDQEKMSRFLRNEINPVIHRLQIGLIIIHHTNKPPKKNETGGWGVNEESYDGSGTAELTNWARTVLVLKSTGDGTRFRLIAAKRGQRIGWLDSGGEKTREKYIRHGDSGICWLEMTDAETAALKSKTSGTKKIELPALLEWCHGEVKTKAWKKSDLRAHVIESRGISGSCYDREVKHWLKDRDDITEKTIRLGSSNCYLIGTKTTVETLAQSLSENHGEVTS